MLYPFFITRLPGGIGNQLFSLFASRYLAQETGLINYLDFEGIDYSHHQDRYDISNFQLKDHEIFLELKDGKGLGAKSIQLLHNLKLQVNRRSTTLGKFLKLYDCGLEPLNSLSVSKLINDTCKRRNAAIFSSVSGYFPDFTFFDNLRNPQDKLLRLAITSKEFQKLEQFLFTNKVLGVHIRLSDFLIHPNTIGNLSNKYFISAIKTAVNFQDYDEVWIFSDAPKEALSRLKGYETRVRFRFIGINQVFTPCEDLFLLKNCSGIICSNSTFSFWAAKFMSERDPSSQVYIPNSFRKDETTKIYGLPSTWHRRPVDWILG